MLYFLYTIIYISVLIVLLPFEYLRRTRQNRRIWLRERMAISVVSKEDIKPSMWIHAVSVGEVASAVPFIKKINSAFPNLQIIVSTVTDTGRKVAIERLADIAKIVYIPFDIPLFIRSAINRYSPSIFIIMETELWPNIIKEFSKTGIPVVLINGRISERSYNGYLKIRFFIKDVLQKMDKLCMQNELYAKRIMELGAPAERLFTTGNFKFDARPPGAIPEWTKILNGKVIIAGSTHNPEEELILKSYVKLKAQFPALTLILAPRHPERFKEVEELVKKIGLKCIKRTDLQSQNFSKIEPTVVILDVIGELASVYGACDLAIIGGSFIKHGGQNPLEPAFWSKPILCGPSMENFPFIEEFYREKAALKTNEKTLFDCLANLLMDPEEISLMGKRARELYLKNSGAIDKTFNVVRGYLK